mgnify:CR=1 FL=1
MRIVEVNASKSYKVYIEQGLIDSCGEIVKSVCKGSKAVIVSDSNVAPLYADRVKTSLEKAGLAASVFIIEAGEASKNPENLVKAADFCIEEGLTRSDVIVALGGGVITDLAGLCGALFQRGVAVVQIPTSLLAMTDSSVGGKTAVNLSKGKNMYGAFYQPRAVICDSAVLSTLPCEEFSNGIAEVIKYAVLRGGRLKDILEGDVCDYLDEMIEECVSIKRDYVCKDEFDTGVRQFLNLGHTVGHAIERVSNFGVAHGSAVSAGMCIVARACAKSGVCDLSVAQDIENLCKKYSLPISCEYDYNMLYEASLSDKKREGAEISVVMVKAFGDCYLYRTKTEFLKELIEKGDTDK